MELSACNEKISNRFLHFVLLLSYQPPYVSVCIGMYHFVAPKTDREVESIAPIRLSSYAEGSVEFVWRRCQYVAAGRLEQIMLCWSLTSPNFNTNHWSSNSLPFHCICVVGGGILNLGFIKRYRFSKSNLFALSYSVWHIAITMNGENLVYDYRFLRSALWYCCWWWDCYLLYSSSLFHQ